MSIDGIVSTNFPKSLKDTSIAQEMGVNIFPALFVVDLTTLEAIPLAFGMVSVSQIEDNITMQLEDESHD